MTKKDDLQTLEQVVSKYSIVLMDNSLLSNYLGHKQNAISIEGKGIALEEEYRFTIVLIDYIKKGNPCFITSSVVEEFQARDRYPYKKIIKRDGSCKNRELLKLRRKIRGNCKERRKLIDTFWDSNRILKLSKNEHNLYNLFYRTYSGFLSLYKLSEVDFDLLVSGAVMSQTRESSALASNDVRGIFHAWKHIRKRENISSKQFGFIVREGINDFKKLE